MNAAMRVLVVDDDRRMVQTTCDILKVKGYVPIPAYSGEEAVALVDRERLGCVLMDLKMPGIDGVEALGLIRTLAPDLPVVLMSAYASEEKMAEAKRRGAYAVLAKPVDIQSVLSFLATLGKEESILIVDDDPAFCRTLRDILRARGYRVATETAAGNVLEHMTRDYQLLVVLDLKLGTADGVEVLKGIRGRYPTKPVVMVTAYKEGMSAAIEVGFQVGAHACLYKPFEAEMLFKVIEEISKMKLCSILGESP